MSSNKAWGFGLATICPDGRILDVWYPEPALGEAPADAQASQTLSDLQRVDDVRGVELKIIKTEIDLDDAPHDSADIFLRLHLLSTRLAKPNTLSLEGIDEILEMAVWTNVGPCRVEDFAEVRARICASTGNPIFVLSVDRIPRMLDYVVPEGVQITDGDRIRLGAYLAEGTVCSHAAFVDYNAGSLGPASIEGRLNIGVTVGAGSKIGAASSTMGSPSTTPETRVTLGENCNVGNNAGVGIALGNNCRVEDGLYIKGNDKVTILPTGGIVPGSSGYIEDPAVIRAHHLAGIDNIIFRRNSRTGTIEALPQEGYSGDVIAQIVERIRGIHVR